MQPSARIVTQLGFIERDLVATSQTLLTPATASEVVNLEPAWDDATLAIVAANTDCPHDSAGLVDWHSGATWGGLIPAADEDVFIPEGASVLISKSPLGNTSAYFGKVSIPAGSELIIGENIVEGIAIGVTGFEVKGALRAGAPGCRLASNVTITLHGVRPTPGYDGIISQSEWIKGIYTLNGTIDLHGVEFNRTWTRLAAQAEIGDTTVHLQHTVNWEVGMTVVITGTTLKDARDFHQNELRQIQLVAGDGRSVTLSAALSHVHIAGAAYQAEVALLSRRMTVQGSESDSPPTDQTHSGSVGCTKDKKTLGDRSVCVPLELAHSLEST